MDENLSPTQLARQAFAKWQEAIQQNIYAIDADFQHTIQLHFANQYKKIDEELNAFGQLVATELEPLVQENNLSQNLPRLDAYDAIGNRIDHVHHHPSYIAAGDIIYGSHLLEKMAEPGGLMACLSFLFLSAQTGEAGHNCPIACSAGIIRVLQKLNEFPNKAHYLEKLTAPAFTNNFTGAQFLTEIQGGSDVGLNAVQAEKDADGNWRIYGEKWFCSNANANLIFLTARYDQTKLGTKGLALFLIPAEWNNQKNLYKIRRLKDKIGTRSMATGEIDFNGAYAIAVGDFETSFYLVMDNVLHLSRLFNSYCVLGMARRAYFVAHAYAQHRVAFSNAIINYPLVQENLAKIKAENTAMLAGIYATAHLQDKVDISETNQEKKLLLRLLVNMLKYLTALWSVEHIHHSLDVLAGNGTIETFSPIPRLLRDCIVCENWEGTHNLLRTQIHKDILKYSIDQLYLAYMSDELMQLKQYSQHTHGIKQKLDLLANELVAFRQLGQAQQALKIKYIVDQMAILFCGLNLLIEALDQQKNNDNSSKLDCFYYFSLLHVDDQKINHDADYLELLTRIINIK